MNALAVSTVAGAVAVEPGFEAILSLVAEAYGIPAGELRAREDEDAAGARDCFLWLCDQLKTRGTLAAASFIGVPAGDALAAIGNVERQRASDPAVRDHTDELALTLHCEAVVMDRLGLHRAGDPSPDETARRILASRRAAGLVGIEQLQALAAAYARLRLSDESERLAMEVAQLRTDLAILQDARERAEGDARRAREELARTRQLHAVNPIQTITLSVSFEREFKEFVLAAAEVDRASGAYARTARIRFDKACLALALAGESHFNITRKFK